jgi:phage shock protein PspC (stress-responsive transcriptional regulator)
MDEDRKGWQLPGSTTPPDRKERSQMSEDFSPKNQAEDQPRRLRRSSSDRLLLGVGGGLGEYFHIDPVIVRIGFVISMIFGGIGAGAYLLLAFFVPTDGEPDWAQRVGRRLQTRRLWQALGAIAVAAVAAAGLLALAGASAFTVALGLGVPVGIAVIAAGAVLALTALRGRGLRWLIPPALAIAAGAGLASASDLNFRGGIGDREYRPLSTRSIPSDGYKLGVGRLVVDLRQIDWKEQAARLELHLGAGQANIFVPSRVCVVGTGHVGVGESEVVGERSGGFGSNQTVGSGSTALPQLDIDADVEVGQLRVINSDTATVENLDHGSDPFHDDAIPQRNAETEACASG